LRKAFHIPDRVNRSGDNPYEYADGSLHEKCRLIMEHFEIYLHVGIPMHMNTAVTTILDRYRKRGASYSPTIAIAKNRIERFFMKPRHNLRKRMGCSYTSNILSQIGEETALFQNLNNRGYLQVVLEQLMLKLLLLCLQDKRDHSRIRE